MRRILLTAVSAAIVLVIAVPAAGAATLRGRILGEPQVRGDHATVPVALDDASIRSLGAHAVEAVVTVPARSGFRTVTTGRSSARATRLGDVVSARVRGLRGGRASARYIKIEQRSSAPPFSALGTELDAASAGARQALAEVQRIAATEQSGPQDPAQLRFFLLGVRYRLNLLIDGLRSQATGLHGVAAAVRASAPESADVLLAQIDQAGSQATDSAQKLEDGVAGLDDFINSIGGESAPPLPVGTVSTVGALIGTVMQVLDSLGGGGSEPGPPTLPAPLQGVPVPLP